MRSAVIDIGGNSVRMVVADRSRLSLTRVFEDRAYLGLGEQMELYGYISDLKVHEVSKTVRDFASKARALGTQVIETAITSPGRDCSNAEELIAAISKASSSYVNVLSTEEEGRLAFLGAAATTQLNGRVIVCDIGGGSTEIVFAEEGERPSWFWSCPIGAMRLTAAFIKKSTGKAAVVRAGDEVDRRLKEVHIPGADTVLVTGGTARVLRKIVGPTLSAKTLASALKTIRNSTPKELVKRYGIDRKRTETLLGGAVIVAGLQRKLGTPLEVARGGLREGMLLTMVERAAA